MTFPSEKGDDILVELVGAAMDEAYEEDFRLSTEWIATRDAKTISVAVSTPSVSNGKVGVEEGLFVSGESEPLTIRWNELPPADTNTAVPPGHGGRTVNTTSGQVTLTGRYFRVHAYGFTAITGVRIAVRRIERNI